MGACGIVLSGPTEHIETHTDGPAARWPQLSDVLFDGTKANREGEKMSVHNAVW